MKQNLIALTVVSLFFVCCGPNSEKNPEANNPGAGTAATQAPPSKDNSLTEDFVKEAINGEGTMLAASEFENAAVPRISGVHRYDSNLNYLWKQQNPGATGYTEVARETSTYTYVYTGAGRSYTIKLEAWDRSMPAQLLRYYIIKVNVIP